IEYDATAGAQCGTGGNACDSFQPASQSLVPIIEIIDRQLLRVGVAESRAVNGTRVVYIGITKIGNATRRGYRVTRRGLAIGADAIDYRIEQHECLRPVVRLQ